MDLRDFIFQSLEHTRLTTLRIVKPLTPDQMGWRPGPEANHIAFLLFHIFRVEDLFFQRYIAGTDELWEQKGWCLRWELPGPPFDPDPIWTVGHGWTSQEVSAWKPPPLDELLIYGAEVREGTMNALMELDMRRLPEIVRTDRRHMTIAYYLDRGSHHEVLHQGQSDYILGLLHGTGQKEHRTAGAFTSDGH